MTHPLRTRAAIATFAGLSVAGALAGCTSTPTTSAGVAPGGSGSTTHVNYKDGSYTEPGTYLSPGGTEHISVTLSLAKNIITAMKVVTVKADPTATAYEQMFEAGIGAATVGKDINTLDIGVVAGSSLTSMGFNRALAAIKADASR